MGPEEPVLGACETPVGACCPRCGRSRAPGGAPACGCARETAEAVRETRSAQAAAAEDFDPLRIRPYVTLPEPQVPLPALSSAPPPPAARRDPARAAGERGAVRTSRRRARRGRTTLLAGAGALFASAAVFATGMLSEGDGGGSDRALPDTTASTDDDPPPEEPAARVSAEPVHSPPPRPTPSRALPSPSASPTPSASHSPRPLHAPATSPTRTTARATGTVSFPPSPPPVLRLGDRGPEVTELQHRLRQLQLYAGPADGAYTPSLAQAVARYQWTRGITQDPPGAYGKATRRSLEAETEA
ncbi:peptidoglycan-binding protein [Streptomyces spectabilis]|uniref:Peptidoglycan-binding protein n=1 Tax=Streptomyces spectabilis TaxID=68270 RepID=A0A5P2X8Q5_STRST|nr:peptidoglycan-binding protein [Streptomyces spectabilis]